MNRTGCVLLAVTALVVARQGSATTFSLTGTLAAPQDYATFTLDLPFSGGFTLQTYGFGGGTNLAAELISRGGFDPFVGVFEGTGPAATFIDGTSDLLSNYTSEPAACPPAGRVTIGSVTGQCGDVALSFTGLTAGLYTIVLSDALYYPAAAGEFPPAYLGDGFDDLTGGSPGFQTCYDSADCNTDTGNWALDINVAEDGATLITPEPASFGLTGLGLLCAACVAFRLRSIQTNNPERT